VTARIEGISKTEKPRERGTEEVEECLKIMEVKKLVYSGKRPEGLQEECVGNQGPQGTAAPEKEQEVE
jgi:hypothetical protein